MTAIPKSVPKKLRDRVTHWDDERAAGNSILITLKHGWHAGERGTHVFGEDTVKQAIEHLRLSEPCDCKSCSPAP